MLSQCIQLLCLVHILTFSSPTLHCLELLRSTQYCIQSTPCYLEAVKDFWGEKKASIKNNFAQQTETIKVSFSETLIYVYCTTYELLPDVKKS